MAAGGRLTAVRYTTSQKAFSKTCWLISAMRYRTLWETATRETVVSVDIHDDSVKQVRSIPYEAREFFFFLVCPNFEDNSARNRRRVTALAMSLMRPAVTWLCYCTFLELQVREIARLERRLVDEGKQVGFTYWRAGGVTCENGCALPVRLGVRGAHAHTDGGLLVWRAVPPPPRSPLSSQLEVSEVEVIATKANKLPLGSTTAFQAVSSDGELSVERLQSSSSTLPASSKGDMSKVGEVPPETATKGGINGSAAGVIAAAIMPSGRHKKRNNNGDAEGESKDRKMAASASAPPAATPSAPAVAVDARAAVARGSGFESFPAFVCEAMRGCSHDKIRGCDEMLLDGKVIAKA